MTFILPAGFDDFTHTWTTRDHKTYYLWELSDLHLNNILEQLPKMEIRALKGLESPYYEKEDIFAGERDSVKQEYRGAVYALKVEKLRRESKGQS